MFAWQDMASAPRTGRDVLVKAADDRELICHYMPGGHCIEDHPPIDAGWYFRNGNMYDRLAEPISWRELL